MVQRLDGQGICDPTAELVCLLPSQSPQQHVGVRTESMTPKVRVGWRCYARVHACGSRGPVWLRLWLKRHETHLRCTPLQAAAASQPESQC